MGRMFTWPRTRTGWFGVFSVVFAAIASAIGLVCILRAHDIEFLLALFGLTSAVALFCAEVALTRSHIDEAEGSLQVGVEQSALDVGKEAREAHDKMSQMVVGVSQEICRLGKDFRDWIAGSPAKGPSEYLAPSAEPTSSRQQTAEDNNPP